MTDFEDAKLAIEYRPEIKAIAEKIAHLPKEFEIRFYEVLTEQPRIGADELESLILGEYEKWLNPYDTSELNDALNEIRSLGPKAEHDFKEVIDKLGTSVSCDKVVSRIQEKYGRIDSSTTHTEIAPDVSFTARDSFDSEPSESTKNLDLNTNPTDTAESTVSVVKGPKTDEDGWIFDHVVPWRRYAARMFDMTFNGVILWMLIGVAAYQIVPYEADRFFNSPNPIVDVIATSFLGCFSTGILVGFTGTTIGKWIFGIRVFGSDGNTIGISSGILRDLTVWMKGLAFGIPLFSLVTLILSYKELRNSETTSWDAGQYAVLHRPSGAFQYFLNIIGIIIFFVMTVIVRVLSEM